MDIDTHTPSQPTEAGGNKTLLRNMIEHFVVNKIGQNKSKYTNNNNNKTKKKGTVVGDADRFPGVGTVREG